MKSLRLNTIASFIKLEDKVADIGCDHAYLSIYLAKNNLCKKVIATDINKNALQLAKKNIKENNLENSIKAYLSDGLKQVNDYDIDTLVISGMGTNTILQILNYIDNFPIKKLILQSNNDLPTLRKELKKINFYLQKEKVVYEKKHYYVIGVYTKNHQKLSYRDKLFGKYDSTNLSYYISMYNELLMINKKLNFKKNWKDKIKIKIKMVILKKYL